jgi:hypothetical protein
MSRSYCQKQVPMNHAPLQTPFVEQRRSVQVHRLKHTLTQTRQGCFGNLGLL